jgi:predicted nucleotidyltransferase
MSKIEVKKIAEKYVEKLKQEKFPFSAIYLFGSYVNGKPTKFSDIDIAVISDKLKKDWNINEEKLWEYTIDVNSKIEPIGFTVADFKSNIDPMILAIKKTDVRIA